MTIEDLLRDFWGALVAVGGWGVAWIVWMIRLEAKAIGNEAAIRRLWIQRKEDLEAAETARRETSAMLGEIRSDVKQLLVRDR